jgi:hypothetical protein
MGWIGLELQTPNHGLAIGIAVLASRHPLPPTPALYHRGASRKILGAFVNEL